MTTDKIVEVIYHTHSLCELNYSKIVAGFYEVHLMNAEINSLFNAQNPNIFEG